jgi:hypothetical protein
MTTTSTRLRRLLALGVVAGVTLAACGDDDATSSADAGGAPSAEAVLAGLAQAQVDRQAATTQYVGTVEGSGAYIAVVDRGGVVEAYVCDGAGTYAWLRGTAEDGTVTATSATDDEATTAQYELAAQLEGDQVAGTVTFPDGTQHAFTATKATGKAGLYQRVWSAEAGEPERVATIVLPDGTQKGGRTKAKKGYCNELKSGYEFVLGRFHNEPDDADHWINVLGDTMNEYAEFGCVDLTGSISSPTT